MSRTFGAAPALRASAERSFQARAQDLPEHPVPGHQTERKTVFHGKSVSLSVIRVFATAVRLTAAIMPGAAVAQETADQLPASGPAQWLAAGEALLRLHSGREISLTTGASIVPYAPLSAIWNVSAERPDQPIKLAGSVRAGGAVQKPFMAVTWEDGSVSTLTYPAPLPEIARVGPSHPVAAFHDRLLALPLVRSIAGIPAGTRFQADGTVMPPVGSEAEDHAPRRWRSIGDIIEITEPSGERKELHWMTLAEALGGVE